MLSDDGFARTANSPGGKIRESLRGYFADLVIFMGATAGAAAAMDLGRAVTAVLLYLTGVLVIGARSGMRSGMLAALVASFVFNFFLSDPRFRFGVTTLDELVPLIAFNLAAFVSGGLAGRLKDAVKGARQAERRNELLLAISDDLQRAVSVGDVVNVAGASFTRHGLPIASLLVRLDGKTERYNISQPATIAERAADDEDAVHIDLVGSDGPIGAVTFGAPHHIRQDFRPADLRAAANLLMIALDRCLLLERLSNAMAVERSEKLKDALLSSVSHDLRTPLTAIEAAATSLRSFRNQLSSRQQDEMLDTIAVQCAKLNRLTANLLDMGRIQSGIRQETLSRVDVAEILGVALASVRTRFPTQQFEKEVHGDYFWVRANEPMLEQVLVNILENAALHGGSDGPIGVKLERSQNRVRLLVRDYGQGVEEPARVFERFYRGSGTTTRHGAGLGLHIARGFTEAFGGTVKLENAMSGAGALATVIIPIAGK